MNTVEALVSGHPREAEKVLETGAGRLRECVHTEFVEFKRSFLKAAVSKVVPYESVRSESFDCISFYYF